MSGQEPRTSGRPLSIPTATPLTCSTATATGMATTRTTGTGGSPSNPRRERLISALREEWRQVEKNGQGEDITLYSIHLEANLARLADGLIRQTLSPTAFAFVATEPQPREIYACDIDTRILQRLYDHGMRPLMEAEMSPRSYNNRVGMGSSAAINQVADDILEVTKGWSEEAWIVKLDIRACFPQTDLRLVYESQSDLIARKYRGDLREELEYILRLMVSGEARRNAVRLSPPEAWADIPHHKRLREQPDGKGAMIGALLFQFADNYLLTALDRLAERNGWRMVRFMDDMVFIIPARDKARFLTQGMAEIRETLAALGWELNGKFYCQTADKAVPFLGKSIRQGSVYPGKRQRRSAAMFASECGHASASGAEMFAARANSRLGLLRATGAMGIADRMAAEIPKDWLRYVEYDRDNWKFSVKPQYKKIEIYKRKLNINYKYHGKERAYDAAA